MWSNWTKILKLKISFKIESQIKTVKNVSYNFKLFSLKWTLSRIGRAEKIEMEFFDIKKNLLSRWFDFILNSCLANLIFRFTFKFEQYYSISPWTNKKLSKMSPKYEIWSFERQYNLSISLFSSWSENQIKYFGCFIYFFLLLPLFNVEWKMIYRLL